MLSKVKLKGPWRITFDTNPDQCNLKCIMCEEHSKYNKSCKKTNRIMNFDTIEKVIEEMVNYGLKEIIPSTMGEPLLYSKFEDTLEVLKKHNLKINLTTNGTFPRLGVEEWGQLILPLASDVKISINGASKSINESIMEGISFEEQIANIKTLVKIRDKIRKEGINNSNITFQATFMKKNLDEIPDLLKIAINMDIDRFKGHHLWITHQELEQESLKKDKSIIRKWNETVKELKSIAENSRLKDGSKIILDNIYLIPYNNKYEQIPNNYFCPFLGREAWIAWDGTFNICCAPDNLRKALGYYGNVKDVSFMELWNSKNYRQLVNNWGTYQICKECNMRRPLENFGECLNE